MTVNGEKSVYLITNEYTDTAKVIYAIKKTQTLRETISLKYVLKESYYYLHVNTIKSRLTEKS